MHAPSDSARQVIGHRRGAVACRSAMRSYLVPLPITEPESAYGVGRQMGRPPAPLRAAGAAQQ